MITRRAAIALALAATSCSTGGGSSETLDPAADLSEQTLTVSIWADYYPEDLAEQFEEATGVKTTIVNHTTNEDIVAKLTASADPGIDVGRPLNSPFAHVARKRFIEVYDHHDAGLRSDACNRNEPDPHRRRQVVVHERQQPDAASDRKGKARQHQERLRPPAHRQV